jgi:hypothetical protein
MRKMLVATIVVGLVAAAANATVTWTATYNGLYDVQDGAKSVNSWNLSFSSDSSVISGGQFDLLLPGYQMGWPDPPAPPTLPDTLTPTWDLGQYVMVPSADCHFNVLSADFVPAIVSPAETNDFSFGPNSAGDSEGLGTLTMQSGFSLTAAAATLDLVNLAWLTTDGVVGITDVPQGNPIAYALIGEKTGGLEYEFWFYVPEPASMTMLGLGAVAMFLRRRRS